jgi:hypothetical protein
MVFTRFLPLHFFEACEKTWPGSWIRQGQWAFAVTETLHILVLGMLLGTIVVVDLSLLGIGMKRQSPDELASDLAPWSWAALTLMVLTGIPLFMSEALRLSKSGPFFYKMLFLVAAIATHTIIFGGGARPRLRMSPAFSKLMGCLSILCWLGVALAGRAIAFPFLLHFGSTP